jgi:hypothetical protein
MRNLAPEKDRSLTSVSKIVDKRSPRQQRRQYRKALQAFLKSLIFLPLIGNALPAFADTYSINGFALNVNPSIKPYDTKPEVINWKLDPNDLDQHFDKLPTSVNPGATMLRSRGIMSKNGKSACLNGNYRENTRANAWDPCDAKDPAMAWYIIPKNGGNLLKNHKFGLCLQMQSAANYGFNTMQTCNENNPNQLWGINVVANPPRGYYPTLGTLTNDQWDVYSGDNTRFDPPLWAGEVDERSKTPTEIAQIYTDLTTTIFGQRRRMTAGYLYDASYFKGEGKWHAAIDIDAPNGTPVKAVIGGTTWNIQNTTGNYFMAVKGDDGKLWIYGHLGSLNVGNGVRIEAGTVVGKTGSLNHLHLEVQNNANKYEQTIGAHPNQQFVRDVTFSPLQAFWQVKNR